MTKKNEILQAIEAYDRLQSAISDYIEAELRAHRTVEKQEIVFDDDCMLILSLGELLALIDGELELEDVIDIEELISE